MRTDLLVMVAAFLGVTLVAEALGAANTGTAASFGLFAFAIALVAILVKR